MSNAPGKPILLRALKRLSQSRFQAALAVALRLGATVCARSGPWILRHAVDDGLRAGQPNLRVIGIASSVFLAIALLALLMSRWHTRLTGFLGERFVRDLRQDVFAHLLSM